MTGAAVAVEIVAYAVPTNTPVSGPECPVSGAKML